MHATPETYLIGVGIADITGEAGGVGMMGYAMPLQRTAGILQRQWARAFVVAEPGETGRRVVFVNTDTGMVFTSVHQEVLRRLRERHGALYTQDNVMLSATHSHSGPGGYSHYNLYNITTMGFRSRTFEAMVDGIVTAIERAAADAAPGQVRINSGEVYGANVNRALLAFERNPVEDKASFPGGVDPRMTVLRFERDGKDVGVLCWFATHGTSMTNRNRLINSDNRGYAAYVWEHDWAGRSSLAKGQGASGFVAGFAQSNAGDMSPNVGAGDAYGPADNEFANTRIIGGRLALGAKGLFDDASERLSGPIDCRKRHVDFSHIEIESDDSLGSPARTWPAVIGQAFTGGTFDGHGLTFIRQGDLSRHPMWRLLDKVVVEASEEVIAGHGAKPAALATGVFMPVPWTPQILPLQVLRIGQLAIVGGPGEFTITSGKRIREAVASGLGGLVTRVVFAGYANAYSGYVTTPEEYSAQFYEGASTHFGPATLPAYEQEFRKVATAMADGRPTHDQAESPDLADRVWSFDPARRIFDLATGAHSFGTVTKQPKPAYRRGDIAVAQFHSANPNNDTRNGSTYLEIQRRQGGEWLTIASDDDWETQFRWKWLLPGVARAEILWRIPEGTQVGVHRIVHSANARTRAGEIREFTGITDEFEVLD